MSSINKINFRKYKAIVTDFKKDAESVNYDGCEYTLDDNIVIYRKGLKTPTKLGYFVTLYKRGSDSVIRPYDLKDKFDLVMIYVTYRKKRGIFIFNKEVLNHNGIISGDRSVGKRGFRIYAPWDKVTSSQAVKTKLWQSKYFTTLTS